MKVLLDKYPMGSLKNQKTAGRYMEGFLYQNLQVMAQTITKDMTFLAFIFSSTLEVGTGKSVFATQIGETWTELMKKTHNIDVPFTTKNIVWRPKELMERAFQVPKYSYILLDEWEDNHYWSELGITLRQFFRKCRQLNLFIMCIIPNWFELPKGFAISRSVFAIDVKFEKNFTRGFYGFYSFNDKRKLYIKGKKDYNYNVARSSFSGRFTDGYGVPREAYIKAKAADLEKWEGQESNEVKRNYPKHILSPVAVKLRRDGWSMRKIGDLLNKHHGTIQAWLGGVVSKNEGVVAKSRHYNLNTREIEGAQEPLPPEGGA